MSDCILKNTQLTVRYGLHRISTSILAAYGLVLANVGKLEQGYRYGKLANTLVKQLDAKEWDANMQHVFHFCMRHWKDSCSECIDSLVQGY